MPQSMPRSGHSSLSSPAVVSSFFFSSTASSLPLPRLDPLLARILPARVWSAVVKEEVGEGDRVWGEWLHTLDEGEAEEEASKLICGVDL